MVGLDEFEKNFDEKIKSMTLLELSSALRRYATRDLKHLEKIITKNREKILEFLKKRIPNAKLSEIGEFIYVICVISEDLCSSISRYSDRLWKNISNVILNAELSDIGAFLSGVSHVQISTEIFDLCLKRIKEILHNSNTLEICDFLAHIGMANATLISHIIKNLEEEVRTIVSRSLQKDPLDVFIMLLGYIYKIDRELTRQILNTYADTICQVFNMRIHTMGLDETTSFLLIMAQIDNPLADRIIQTNMDILKERFDEEIKTLLSFIERIKTSTP